MEISFTEFKSILLKNFFFLSNYLSKIAAAFDNIDINFFKNTFSVIAKTTNFWNLSILIILENSNLNDISKISLLLLLSQAQESLWNRGKYRWNISKKLLLPPDRIKIQEKLIFFDSNENEKIIKKKYLLNKQKRSYSSHDRLVNSPGGGGGWPPFIPGDSLTNTDYGEPRKRRDKTSPISFISLNCPRYRKTISPRLVSTPIAGFLIKEIYEFSNSCPRIQFRKKNKEKLFFHGWTNEKILFQSRIHRISTEH